MSKVTSPHDHMFKTAMTDIRVAREFFETYLPKDLLEMVNLNHLKLCPNSYVDQQLKASESDILYETSIVDEPAYILLLAEHQSSPDTLMPFRLIKYMVRIWDDYLKQNPNAKLPLIVPIVFYHGRHPYTYNQDIRDLIAAPKDLIDKHLFTPFHLIDTHDIPDETLREQQWSGTMAFFMKHIFARDFLPYLQKSVAALHRLEQLDGNHYVLTLLQYALKAAKIPDVETFVETIKKGLSAPTGETIMTIEQQLIERGKKQGMQQGMIEGEKLLLIKQLNRRFHALPSSYVAKIKNADAEVLLLWGERILDAQKLEDVFGK